jgi:hypothetical protein
MGGQAHAFSFYIGMLPIGTRPGFDPESMSRHPEDETPDSLSVYLEGEKSYAISRK